MKTSLFILGFLMTTPFAGYAKSYDNNCFREHIVESIKINKSRKKAYSELTQGRSDKIFNTLIGYEVVTIAPATFFDLKALPYQKNGMGLFCHEFMSLNHAPDFDPDNRIAPKEPFKNFDWKFHKNRITEAIRHRDSHEVRKVTLDALLELKSMPHYYCMTRHLIESIYRFAHFVPLRDAEAVSMDLKSPKKIMFDVMKLHLLGMKDSHKIDLWSQPIQMSGIPILCSEIPDLLFDLRNEELNVLRH
jgi:hypothetical protein